MIWIGHNDLKYILVSKSLMIYFILSLTHCRGLCRSVWSIFKVRGEKCGRVAILKSILLNEMDFNVNMINVHQIMSS